MILRHLAEGTLQSIRLADPGAGKLDDLQLRSSDRLDAYQFKWSVHPGSFTFGNLTQPERGQPPLLASLVEGWRLLKAANPGVHVVPHLVSNEYPAIGVDLPGMEGIAPPRHFSAFLSEGWEPLQAREVDTLPVKWAVIDGQLQDAANCRGDEWREFVAVCKLEFRSTLDRFPTSGSAREKERWEDNVTALAQILFAQVASPRAAVEYTRAELFSLLGWSDESAPLHVHEFPVDDRIYEPIELTVQKLEAALGAHQSGYICLTGPPGAGKSSLLTKALRKRNDHVVRYYAFVPSDGGRDVSWEERGEATNFLHDILTKSETLGLGRPRSGPHRFDLHILRERFRAQMRLLGDHYQETGRRTLLLLDGLDHIVREQQPVRSLLAELPSPESLPQGVVFILGTQDHSVLPPAVQRHVLREGRHISTEPLPGAAVRRALRRVGLHDLLSEEQIDQCIAKINGHPLALGLLINALEGRATADDIPRILDEAERYQGNIVAFYDGFCAPFQKEGHAVLGALGLFARIGMEVDVAWAQTWLEPAVWIIIQRRFHPFFRRNNAAQRWSFFHNSFRLFIRQLTAETVPGEFDPALDRRFFHRLAEHAAASPEGSFWRGEEVFYRAEAGEDDAVLALVTPSNLREQFLALRPVRQLYQQLALGRDALTRSPSLSGIVRLGLVERELRAREETFGLERETIFDVLLATQRYDLLITHLRSGPHLRYDAPMVLRRCREMHRVGLREEARQLFDLVNPHDAPGHARMAFDPLQGQRETLSAWLLAGIEILGVQNAVDAVRKYEFRTDEREAAQRWGGRSTDPIDHEKERRDVFTRTVIALYAEEKWELAEELQAALGDDLDTTKLETERELCRIEVHLVAGEKNEASTRMHALFGRLRFSGAADRLGIAEICARTGLLDETAQLVAAITPPPLDAASCMPLGTGARAVTPLQYYRLRYACGETRSPVRLAPHAPSLADAGLALFYHAACVVARLWGRGWRGERLPIDHLREQAQNLFAALNRDFHDQIRWSGIYSDLTQDRHAIFTALADAISLQGAEAVGLLTELFASDWEHPSRGRYWEIYVKRDVCLRLHAAGADPLWVTRWLEHCEAEATRPDRASSQASECSAQAAAWITVGQADRAATMLAGLLRSSLNITHSKDDQLAWWITLLRPIWAKDPAAALPKLSWFTHCLETLQHDGDYEALRQAAAKSIGAACMAAPSAARKLFAHLLDEGVVRYDDGLAEIIGAALDDPHASLRALYHLTCDVLIPVAVTAHPPLACALFTRIGRKLDHQQTIELTRMFSQTVRVEALPATRHSWLRGARKGAHLAGCEEAARILMTDLAALPADLEQRSYSGDGEATMCDRMVAGIKTLADLRAAVPREDVSTHFKWQDVIAELAPGFTTPDLVASVEIFHDKRCYAHVCRVAGDELCRRGATAEAARVSENALHRLEENADPYDTPRMMFVAALPLLRAAPERALARIAALFDEHGGPELDQMDELLRASRGEAANAAAAAEIEAFARVLLSNCGERASAASVIFESDFLGETSGASGLATLLFEQTGHPAPLIRRGAQRALRHLLLTREATVADAVPAWLKGDPSRLTALLVVLESVAAIEPQILQPYREPLEQLRTHESFEVRRRLLSICTLAGWPMPAIVTPRPLSVVYRAELPAIPDVPERGAPDEDIVRSAGAATDVSLLVMAFAARLRVLEEFTHIPFQNLCHRVMQLASAMTPSNRPIDPTVEKRLNQTLSDAGLLFPYRRPHAELAQRAVSCLLAELMDGDAIRASALSRVFAMFASQDAGMLACEPGQRPAWVLPIVDPPDGSTSAARWLHAADTLPASMPQKTTDGRCIFAAVSRFKILGSDDRTEEFRVSAMVPRHVGRTVPRSLEDGLFDGLRLPSVADYTETSYPAEIAGLVIRNEAPIEHRGEPWIALHPNVARELGWTHDPGGWFRWRDRAGQVAAESHWWRDGQIARHGLEGEGEVAEGWEVLLSESALREVREDWGGLVQVCRARRHRGLDSQVFEIARPVS